MPLKPQYGNFFEFDENDLIINRIEAFPKAEFFVHSNVVYFNNENNNASNPNVPKKIPEINKSTKSFLLFLRLKCDMFYFSSFFAT